MNAKTIRVIASSIGLLFLFCMIAFATRFLLPSENFWPIVIVACIMAFPFAIAVWKYADTGTDRPSLTTWKQWLGMLLFGMAASAILIGIDIAIAHPGRRLLLTTIGIVILTVMALPGAVRAWVLERLVKRYKVNLDTALKIPEPNSTEIINNVTTAPQHSTLAAIEDSKCACCHGDLVYKEPIRKLPPLIGEIVGYAVVLLLGWGLLASESIEHRLAIIAGAIALVMVFLKLKSDTKNDPAPGLLYCKACKNYTRVQ